MQFLLHISVNYPFPFYISVCICSFLGCVWYIGHALLKLEAVDLRWYNLYFSLGVLHKGLILELCFWLQSWGKRSRKMFFLRRSVVFFFFVIKLFSSGAISSSSVELALEYIWACWKIYISYSSTYQNKKLHTCSGEINLQGGIFIDL